MLRRPITIKQSSSGGSYSSRWEKEASDYWKQMQVDKPRIRKRVYVAIAVVALLAIGGMYAFVFQGQDTPAEGSFRTKCTAQAVQSKWHQEMCNKVCPNNEFNEACMNGCFFGSLDVTKQVCANRTTDTPFSQLCPFQVDCAGACVEYASVRPIPAKRNACEGGCNAVVPSACKRAVDMFDHIVKDNSALCPYSVYSTV
ncbi:hypothetical protein AeRB84_020282 [Aphanomyces euteiches]|nr:hypothetical protein AeRB84_020282 [Aphanomyces euteiches]